MSFKQATPSIISLLTDFGLEDEYVGVMKGVILSINPAVHLVDLTHAIGRHDIEQGALILSASYRHFPKGSIHIAVVDPGVGGARKVVCLRQGGHVFLAPDNGLLTMVIDEKKVEDVRAVTNRKYFLEWVSDTFHGRDIFAPVAAHLSRGANPVRLGESLDPQELTLFDIDYPHVSEKGELVGKVITVDHFGNLVTNIDRGCLEAFRVGGAPEELMIKLGRSRIEGVSRSYDGVKTGAPVAIVGSRNLLEVSVNQGDARSRFRSRVGQTVRVGWAKKRGG